MMTSFSFPNPDTSVQVLDLNSMFSIGSNSAEIRGYGISLAQRYPEVCNQICFAANALYHDHVDGEADLLSPANAIERIGIMLGQQIHKHLLHGEESGNIWEEVCDRLAARATGTCKPSIHILIGEPNGTRPTDI